MPDPADSLAPALARALERDGITITESARVVGLDPRTIRRWGTDDEAGSRAAAFRRLEDWIAGRAQAVLSGDATAWELRDLGEGVAAAEVMRLALEVEAARVQLEQTLAAVHRLRAEALRLAAQGPRAGRFPAPPVLPAADLGEKRLALDLTSQGARGSILDMLDTDTLKTVALEVERHTDPDGMVNLTFRVPKVLKDRVRNAAEYHGMDSSEYLRSISWMCSTAPKGAPT